MKIIKKLLFLLLFFPVTVLAQYTDDFEDGDISDWTQSNTDRWAASDISPFNGSYSLHHVYESTVIGRDQVSVNLPVMDLSSQNTSWRFQLRHNYDPTSGNNWGVFLIADAQADQMFPAGVINGYVIGVNYNDDSDDLIRLWKVTSGSNSVIINSSVNWQTQIGKTHPAGIEIIRLVDGNWEIKIDFDGGFDNLISIGAGFDNSYIFTDYFGISYEYSSTGDKLLWIDDIYIGPEIADNEPPVVNNLFVANDKKLTVEFSEAIDSAIAVNSSNYILDKSIGIPDSVQINDLSSSVDLFFTQSLTNGEYYNLTVSNIEDANGNVMADTVINFLYFVPQPNDVVINEIMADPSPEVNLPGYEYVEIVNTTPFGIDLTGWKIKIGTTEKVFTSYMLDSASYLIVCNTTALTDLSSSGNILGISSFPAITNSGTTITLSKPDNTQISTVSFTTDWYNDDGKMDGGWSIERIDPLNNCSGINNWKASEDVNGGTPGQQNSVYANNADSLAPDVQSVEVISSNQLRLIFSEPIDTLTALNKLNYEVNSGTGNPFSLILSDNGLQIDLLFIYSFSENLNLTLTINNLADWCGNIMQSRDIEFAYYLVQPYDIVINEIMANPDSTVNALAYEYIEIYNTTAFNISLTGWTLTVGTTTRTLPTYVIEPQEYLILCNDNAYSLLKDYGNTLIVSGFPALTNSGQTLVFKSKEGSVISTVTYTDNWYNDVFKAEGGWSLEQTDPYNPCGGKSNWTASTAVEGGTPGQQNSVFGNNSDLMAPELLYITVIDQNTVGLYFNESYDSISAMQLSNYVVDNGVGNPNSITLESPQYFSLILTFNNSFTENVIYNLEITGGITDCSGNEIGSVNSARFAIPVIPGFNDLVINEILFNPLSEGYDFIELYNRSQKTFDLKDLRIAAYDDLLGDYSSVEEISNGGFLVFPGDYIVLSENPAVVQQQYYTSNPRGFVQLSNMPPFSDDTGRAILLDKLQNTIDNFEYNDDMHFALLSSTDGVSLERINFERPTDDNTNWHSASELVGFATPAYENSQYKGLTETEDKIKVDPEVFSPDNDGFEDLVDIQFSFDVTGYVANIKIYDSRGRLIKYLANNILLGTAGTISWDGLTDNNQKTPNGIYIVYIELFDLKGNVKEYRKPVVVAEKL